VIECDRRLQPLGYLAWAACGKDPAFSPKGILAEAARGGRDSVPEIEALDFAGDAPEAATLSLRWHEMLARAHEIVDLLPAAEVGRCVLSTGNELYRGTRDELAADLDAGPIRFHAGSIRGALPVFT